MKLYKITAADHAGQLVASIRWEGTQALSATAKRELKASTGAVVAVEEVDVPTDKAGLLTWLNNNVTGE